MVVRSRFTRPSPWTVTSSSCTVFLPEVEEEVEVEEEEEVEVFLSTSSTASSVPRPPG